MKIKKYNMKIIGIDPGTKGFSILGIEDNDKIFLDEMLLTEEVIKDITKLINIIENNLPVDAIIGPSGYGLPITHIKDTKEEELNLMLPKKSSISVNEAIKFFFYYAKEKNLPVYFTPGVIHLQTIPKYRKINRIDMGTADKLCCCVLALEQYAKNEKYEDCSFIFLEVGYGFTSAVGVKNGKVVDGVGGTSGFPGFLSPGAIDAELAIRIDKQLQDVVFTGGAKSLNEKITLEELAENPEKYSDIINTIIEGALKDIAIIKVNVDTDDIIISGRLTRLPKIKEKLVNTIKGNVIQLKRKAKNASEAAEGACIIGDGILGGKYKKLIEIMEITNAKGTMYDYITMKVDVEK